jgi:hypothetical protein
MIDNSESSLIYMDQAKIEQALKGDRNFSISCKLGVRYPTLISCVSISCELGVRYPTLKACQSHTSYDRHMMSIFTKYI